MPREVDNSNQEESAGGEGRTTEQMQSGTAADVINGEEIYTDWDEGNWNFGSVNECPRLEWE